MLFNYKVHTLYNISRYVKFSKLHPKFDYKKTWNSVRVFKTIPDSHKFNVVK